MDERIRSKLQEVSDNLSIYSAVPPSGVEKVFNFNTSQLETLPTQDLSKFAIILAQYLITLQVRYNTSRVIASQKKKVLDRRVKNSLAMVPLEKGKTVAERERVVIDCDPVLQDLELEYDVAAAERDLIEGLDKPITELINAFKSELRRRIEERHYTDRERL